jgi:hypothetical protein
MTERERVSNERVRFWSDPPAGTYTYTECRSMAAELLERRSHDDLVAALRALYEAVDKYMDEKVGIAVMETAHDAVTALLEPSSPRQPTWDEYIALQRHRDAWRAYALGKPGRTRPADFLRSSPFDTPEPGRPSPEEVVASLGINGPITRELALRVIRKDREWEAGR